jgi:transcriptional regulator with XRE-family HTH domain
MVHLKELRISKGLSQTDVAREVDISRQAYNNYELGKRQADYETLLKLAELFETSVEYLISDTSTNFEQKNIAHTKISRDEGQSLLSGLSDTEITELLNYLGYLRYKRENGL